MKTAFSFGKLVGVATHADLYAFLTQQETSKVCGLFLLHLSCSR